VTYNFFFCCVELSNKFFFVNKYGPILRVQEETITRSVTLASNHGYKQGAVAHKQNTGTPHFYFKIILSSYNINNQFGKV